MPAAATYVARRWSHCLSCGADYKGRGRERPERAAPQSRATACERLVSSRRENTIPLRKTKKYVHAACTLCGLFLTAVQSKSGRLPSLVVSGSRTTHRRDHFFGFLGFSWFFFFNTNEVFFLVGVFCLLTYPVPDITRVFVFLLVCVFLLLPEEET